MGDVRDILLPASTAATGKKKPVSKPSAHDLEEQQQQLEEHGASAPSLRKFTIDPSIKARHWRWMEFQNSARAHALDKSPLKHWSREDIPVEDYPFCRFNKPSYAIRFTREEYQRYVPRDAEWTEEEDFVLLALCKQFDCRWPVVSDRLPCTIAKSSLQCRTRYFKLAKLGIANNVKNFTGEEERDAKLTFDCRAAIKSLPDTSALVERVAALDRLFYQTSEDRAREEVLVREMKLVEEEIKRLKLEKKKQDEAAKAAAAATLAANKRKKSKSASSTSAAPYRPEENEAIVADLPRLLGTSADSTMPPLPPPEQLCWKRSLQMNSPTFVVSAQQHKQFAALCNVRPEVATEAVLMAYRAYRQDSLKLAIYQHNIKRMRSEMKSLVQQQQ